MPCVHMFNTLLVVFEMNVMSDEYVYLIYLSIVNIVYLEKNVVINTLLCLSF